MEIPDSYFSQDWTRLNSLASAAHKRQFYSELPPNAIPPSIYPNDLSYQSL